MRVLLLNYEFPPLGGGAGIATAALADGLAHRGVAVEVLTARAPQRSAARGPEETPDAGAPPYPAIHRVGRPRRRLHHAGFLGAAGFVLMAVPQVRRLIRASSFDLVHFFFSLPTGAMLPLARAAGIPAVVSLRGSDVPGYDPSNRTLAAMHVILKPVTRAIWRHADRVVAVCEALGRLALESLPELSLTVIPNGVDLSLFRPADRARASMERVRCLAVARLVERKGLDCLLAAWRLLPKGRYQLEIVGSGMLREALNRRAAAFGIGGEVTFVGALDRATLADRYRAADLFVLTPEFEAFGNVFAEALASGLPVVASRVGGIPELIEDGVNGILVPPKDMAALAAAVGRLGEDADLRSTIALRNRGKATSILSWERVTDRYLDLYGDLVEDSRRRPAPAPI